MKLVLGISGASGSIYTARLLRVVLAMEGETHITVSPNSLKIFKEEFDSNIYSNADIIESIVERYKITIKNVVHFRDFEDTGSELATGSNLWTAMVVVPCSMKTVAGIANGLSSNLIERCADVTLKERRRLVIVPREAPLSRVHLKNLLAIDEAGGVVLPASPGFYFRPHKLEDLGDFIAAKILNLLGIEHHLLPHWKPIH